MQHNVATLTIHFSLSAFKAKNIEQLDWVLAINFLHAKRSLWIIIGGLNYDPLNVVFHDNGKRGHSQAEMWKKRETEMN